MLGACKDSFGVR